MYIVRDYDKAYWSLFEMWLVAFLFHFFIGNICYWREKNFVEKNNGYFYLNYWKDV